MNRASLALGAFTLALGFSALPLGMQAQTPPAPPNVKAEVIRSIEAAENHLVALAEKFPQEKYGWHPEGARSTSEVFMHIAAGNYAYAKVLGTLPPEGTTSAVLSKITDKAKVVEALKNSFAHLKTAIQNVSDVEKAVKLYGRDATMREAMIVAAAHCHEHLGQLIAYARVNGIVPPWSEEQPKPQPTKPGI